MGSDRCTLCKKDIDRVALSRCRDARCPMTRGGGAGSFRSFAGYSIAIAGLLLGIGKITYVAAARSAPAAEGATLATTAAATPHATPTPTPVIATFETSPRRVSEGWFSRLWHPPRREEEPILASEGPDLSRPDPQAATRVMSFTCADGQSSSRALICTRWDLATADYNLMLNYRLTLAHSTNPSALRRARAAWLKQLDALGSDSARIQRHIEMFQQRLTEL